MTGDQEAKDAVRAQRRLKIVWVSEDRRDAARHFIHLYGPSIARRGHKVIDNQGDAEKFVLDYLISAETSITDRLILKDRYLRMEFAALLIH
jgi:hypothetical protein